MLNFLFGDKVVKTTTVTEKTIQKTERSYSEEDMKAAWTHGATRAPKEFMHLNNFYAWFEQFKKK